MAGKSTAGPRIPKFPPAVLTAIAEAKERRRTRPTELHTAYDEPMTDTESDTWLDVTMAIVWAAWALRRRAHRLLNDVSFSGSGGATEVDNEYAFTKAYNANHEADMLTDEYRRRVRGCWIANHPRKPLTRKGR